MHHKTVLVVAVVVALAGLFLLLGGTDLLPGAGPRGDDAAEPAGGEGALGTSPEAGAGDSREATAARGPVLFGRTRAERAGVGGLFGVVKDFDSGKPIAQATLVLAGEGYAGERSALQAATDESGAFRYDALPAGDAYQLHVTDPQGRARTLLSIAVDAGGDKDVGVLWMGKAAALTGSVLGPDGLPVSGAEVQVHVGGGSMLELVRDMTKLLEVLDQDAQPQARARSDRTGAYEVESLAPGPYTLVVRAPGFQLATKKVVMTNGGAAGGPVTIHLQPGKAIVGVVVDEHDRAIAGARVAFLGKNDMESVFFGRQYTVTDAEGRFRVDAPPTQGSLNAIVAAEGYPTLFSDARLGADELRFVLVAGAEVLVRVLEQDSEQPIEGARLMAMFAETLQASGSKMTFASGVTDLRGEALFLAKPGKLQMLFVSHEDRGNAMYNPMMGMMGQTMSIAGPKDTTVKPPRTELVFRVGAGVTIRGKVADDAGKPLAGVRVATLGMMGGGGSATSGADGIYELQNQSLPVIMVSAALPGYVQVVDRRTVGLTGARPENGVLERDIVMRRAASLTGRVVDPHGRPLPGVEVRVGGDVGMAAIAAFTGGSRQTITNAAGTYVLDGVTPGPGVHVMGRMPGFLDSKTPDFEVVAGVAQAPDLVMQQGTLLVVSVEQQDGGAVQEARVEVDVEVPERIAWDPMSAWQGFADAVTSPAGKAEIRDLPDGDVTLTVTASGFAAGRAHVTTKRAEGTRKEVTVRLRAGVTLRGRVVDAEGKPVEGAVVQTLPADAPAPSPAEGAQVFVPRVSVTTQADGRFALEGLPAALVQVVATAEGSRPVTREVDAGGHEIELQLAPVDASAQRRIEEIDAELQTIYSQFAGVKDDAERNALTRRMLQLQQERSKLQQGDEEPVAEDR